MGTSRGYGGSGSYGSNYLGSSYGAPSRPTREDPSVKYIGQGSVMDKIQKYATSDSRGHGYGVSDNKYGGGSPYSSLDRYSGKGGTGYASDYGGSVRSYGSSWDRASSRSGRSYGNPPSRESSPYSNRSSKYDTYSSSASPFSSYSKRDSKDASPVQRKYDRTQSYDESKSHSRKGRHRVESSTSSESDDSVPEAEKDQNARYLVCRGTSPIPDKETERSSRRGSKKPQRDKIARTSKIKMPKKDVKVRFRGRYAFGEKVPETADIEIQCDMDEEPPPKDRGGGKDGPSDTFYKYRDKFISNSTSSRPLSASFATTYAPAKPRSSSKRDVSHANVGGTGIFGTGRYETPKSSSVSAPNSSTGSKYERKSDKFREREQREREQEERASKRSSWRDAVYGDGSQKESEPETDKQRRRRERQSRQDESDYTSAAEERQSSRRDRRSQMPEKDNRNGFSRSNSRDSVLDEKSRRRRTQSGEYVDDKPSLTTEALSIKDSIDKVNQWKQNLPSPEGYRQDSRRHESGEYLSASEHSRQGKNKPNHRHPLTRGASNETYIEEEDDAFESNVRLPNKDFRKSRLNRADYDESAEEYDRRVRNQRGGHELQSPTQRDARGFDNASDAYSRDGRRLRRNNSREDVIDDKKRSRKERWENDPTHTSDSSLHAFNKEDSPNRGFGYRRPGSRPSSREDMLDDRMGRRSHQYPNKPNSLPLNEGMSHSSSRHSITSQGTLPDLVPHGSEGIQDGKQRRSFICNIKDIDNILDFEPNEEEFVHGRQTKMGKPNKSILDSPVPRTPHPMKPLQAKNPPTDRLIDYDDRMESRKYGNRGAPQKKPPPKLSPTAQQIWDLLQKRQGMVTIAEILTLCEKPSAPKYIRVPGVRDDDKNFSGYQNALEMLSDLRVDTQKVRIRL